METDHDNDHPDFDNESRWPRRLLHVPSMTSYKWEPGNTYKGRREPDYIALSYTWGRYALQEGESPHIKPLPIRDVPWSVPRVNPTTHFSDVEFQHIIWEVMKGADRYYVFDDWKRDTIRGQSAISWQWRRFLEFLETKIRVYEFLWLDIACIDQRWNAVSLLEIGRQARIFRHAKHAYVWLSHLPRTDLESSLFNLRDAVSGLQSEPFQAEPSPFDARPSLLNAFNSLTRLRSDPWFTSLWTLQEAFLCNQAIILSREGRVICDASMIYPRSWALEYLFKLANDIVLWFDRTRTNKKQHLCIQLLDLLHKTGLAALWYNTPMALLGVSRYRTASRELDRVYGIMQVFGNDFRVGNARVDSGTDREYTLTELEDELGAAILQSYPILSQMHIYLEEPGFSKGWCVRGNCAVPIIAERGDMFGWNGGYRLGVNISIGSQALCSFSTRKVNENTWAYLSGRACTFTVIRMAWEKADQSDCARKLLKSGWRMHRCSTPSIQMVALDRGTRFTSMSPKLNVLNLVNTKDEKLQHELAQEISNRSKHLNLRVFLLGRCDFGNETFNAGIMIFEQEDRGVKFWRRIGICVWLVSHLQEDDFDHSLRLILNGEGVDWQHTEGLFG